MDAVRLGNLDDARRLNNGARGLVGVYKARGGLSAMKGTMGLLGVDCGPCRLPLRTLTAAELGGLARELEPLLPVKPPEGSGAR